MYSRKYRSKQARNRRMAGHITLALVGALAVNSALGYTMSQSALIARDAAPVMVADIGELPVVHVSATRKSTQVACVGHTGKV